MSTDYSKKKNAELEDLLKARSLPHTGKKAELIERLRKYDAEQEAAKAAPADGAEDEIDWEDDAAVATDPPAAAAIAAGGLTQPPNPTAVPNQKVDIDPSKTSDLTVDPPAPTTETSETAATKPTETTSASKPDFTTNLPPTHLDAELSKRKARALRFGITESNDDALKALERAKKFGTGDAGDKAAVRGLDEALPERSRKRGRGGGDVEGEEGGKGRQAKRSKVRGGPPRGRRERSGTPGKKATAGGDVYSEADRKRAEERKKRFAD